MAKPVQRKRYKYQGAINNCEQCDEMKKCKNAGLKAYFLICFEGHDVRMIDVDTAIATLKSGSKTISAAGNPSWDLIKILGGKSI